MTAKAPSKTAWRKSGLDIIAAVRRAKANGSRTPDMPNLTYLDFAVLVALSEWLDADALCYRSGHDIADDCGCSVTAIKGAIRRLIEAGLLEKPQGVKKIGRKKGSDGGRPANTYRAVMPRGFGNHASQNKGEVLGTYTAKTSDASEEGFGNHASLGFGNHASPHIDIIREEDADARSDAQVFTDAADLSPSDRATASGGEAPLDGATPAYEPDADPIVLNEDCSGINDVAQPQNSAGSAPRPTGFRADLFVEMKPEQAQDAAEVYFAESVGDDFEAEMFVEDLINGFDPSGGNQYAREGVARALRAGLSRLSANTAAERLDGILAVAEALLVSAHGRHQDLSRELAELARKVLLDLSCDEVKYVSRA